MDPRTPRPPSVTWIYGLLGLLPFFAGAASAIVTTGASRHTAQLILLDYAGLILSFLGGGRWGLEIGRSHVRVAVISASMLPTVCAFVLLIVTSFPITGRLIVMAAALVLQWAWDVRSASPPRWYPMLRHVLTVGAATSLLLGAAL